MKCFECEIVTDCAHEHHVIPKSLGGTKTVLLCENCHGLVHQQNLTISDLTRKALKKRKEQGKRISKYPPYGYKFDGNSVVRNEEEQKIIKIIKRLKKDGRNSTNIANILNKMNIKSRGKKWYSQSVINIIKTYASLAQLD